MTWVYFVVGAMFCWGMYGPALAAGTGALGSGMRALLWVGVAYFLLAVLVPAIFLGTQQDNGRFILKGNIISTIAGVLGALGAICVVYAFRNGGKPDYVMPLVFGGAPVINAIVSMIQNPPEHAPKWQFFLGVILAGVAAFLVLHFKPAMPPHR